MHRASQGIRILLAAIFAVAANLALALPVCAQSVEIKKSTITDAEAKIVFEAPGLDNAIIERWTARTSSIRREHGYWIPFSEGTRLDARISFDRATANLLFVETQVPLRKRITSWFTRQSLTFHDKGSVENVLGPSSYHTFTFPGPSEQSVACVGFQQFFGGAGGGGAGWAAPPG